MDQIFNKLKEKYGEKKWIIFTEQLIYRYGDDGVSAIGAQLAYYLTLSIFPFIIFFLSILQFTPLADANILQRILMPIPGEARDLFYDLIKGIIADGSISLLSVGAIGSIWSSSNGIMALMKAVNRAFDLDEDRPYLKLKGLSILFTLGLFLTLIIAFTVLVFGETIFKMLFSYYTATGLIIWKTLRLIIPLLFMILVFTMLYKWSPSVKKGVKIKFSESLPGAVFSSIGWIVISGGFSYYVSNFGNYSKTYGSLGGVIAFLVWLYMSSIMIVLGAEVNATLMSMKHGRGKRIKMLGPGEIQEVKEGEIVRAKEAQSIWGSFF